MQMRKKQMREFFMPRNANANKTRRETGPSSTLQSPWTPFPNPINRKTLQKKKKEKKKQLPRKPQISSLVLRMSLNNSENRSILSDIRRDSPNSPTTTTPSTGPAALDFGAREVGSEE
jgi:hypothetical protein